jgi:5-hydroxyisourate hydrolase-like protein (transthyretin family)
VGGHPRPSEGVLVELQARRGRRWQTFATSRARRSGRFRRAYRFTRTSGVQRYRLRARVPQQPDYPYAPGGSRPVSVIVYG